MIAIAGSSFAIGGMLGRQGSTTTAPTTTSSALGGPVDALLLPSLLVPHSHPFHVTSRVIAL
jgi:hypothetical protein